jgi:GxxExxY protein
MDQNRVGTLILDAAFKVHSALGPGLLESAYEHCLILEMKALDLTVVSQVALPLIYREQNVGVGYRADLIINHSVLIEVKSVEAINPIHVAQVITYLKLSNCKLGNILNFNVLKLRTRIKRIIL